MTSNVTSKNQVNVNSTQENEGKKTITVTTKQKNCSICLEQIETKPKCKEEIEKELKCQHIFHKECIDTWLKKANTCPLCRTIVSSSAKKNASSSHEELLHIVREEIHSLRTFRALDLNENSDVARTARKVNSLAGRTFGF